MRIWNHYKARKGATIHHLFGVLRSPKVAGFRQLLERVFTCSGSVAKEIPCADKICYPIFTKEDM